MAEPKEDDVVRRRVTKEHQQQTKTVGPGSNPKSGSTADAEAFKECRPILKNFILDIEDRLYSEGIISEDTHDDIHGQSILESEKRRILLDAVEKHLKMAESGAEFDVILGLFKEDPARNIVTEKLSEARGSSSRKQGPSLPPPSPANGPTTQEEVYIRIEAEGEGEGEANSMSLVTARKRSSKSWLWPGIVVIFPTIIVVIVAMMLRWPWTSEVVTESASQRLKDGYIASNLSYMFGSTYLPMDMPYVNLSIFRSPDRDWMARSHKKQGPHNMTSQPVSLDELLNVSTGDRILIVGGPGTGKTRLTYEIMRLWARNRVLLYCELLFVYRLRWFLLQEEDIDLKSIVSMHTEGGPVVDEIVNEAISTGGKKLCFLFDGLDEYEPGYSGDNIKNYVYLLMHRQKLSKSVVIVTTRNITSTGFEGIKWTRRYHVTGFSNEQLRSYFQMQTGKNFTNFVAMYSNLWQMCKIPLHVSLLLNTFGSKTMDTAIFTVTELFEKITIRTFESDLRKANEPGKTFIFKDLKHLLLKFPVFAKVCALAFKGSLYRQYSFLDSEVPLELKGTNLSYFQIEPQPGARNMEVYTFIHPSLMDFLAAVHLTSLNEDEHAVKDHYRKFDNGHRDEDLWKFVCGLTNHFKTLFKELAEYHMHYIWFRPLRIVHCIFEAQSHNRTTQKMQKIAADNFLYHEEDHLIFMFITLTAYDMQAIGYVASLSPNYIENLSLTSVTFADEDYDLSFFFESLASPGVIFSNLYMLQFVHIYDEMRSEQSFIDFIKHTPTLKALVLVDISEPLLQQLASLTPESCNSIIIYRTYLDAKTGITPYSLFNHRKKKMTVLRVINCKISDDHLLLSPWEVDAILIGLNYNNIGNEGAMSLATSIEKSCGPRCTQSPCGPITLDLENNSIGGEGLIALLKAADFTHSLFTYINLTGNNVTDSDVDSIIKACLSFRFRIRYINIILLKNNLTEDSKAILDGLSEKSWCSIYFQTDRFDDGLVSEPHLETLEVMFTVSQQRNMADEYISQLKKRIDVDSTQGWSDYWHDIRNSFLQDKQNKTL